MKSSERPSSQEKSRSADSASELATFPVVAIGASAGGLDAFTQLIRGLPEDTGMAFVFIQHLDPTHHSVLAELLSKATRIPVIEAKNRVQLEPNRVYVIPPNVRMEILQGRLQLTPREEDHGLHLPIDFFMRSLAEERKNRAVGVVLSGTGSDGTLGLAAIKAEGGITFAQEAKSARYDGMPRSAIASGCVDFVLTAEKISQELVRIAHHPYLGRVRAGAVEAEPESNGVYGKIFGLLRKTYGIDFRSYKPGTVRRRTLRRMALHKLDSVEQYLKYLQAHSEEVEQLYQDLLIPVTIFFRDPEAFEALKSAVFPAIVKDKSNRGNIRIWAPGCSTGEETYSLAIALLEFLGARAPSFQIQLFGTDVNERGIEKARSGIYLEQIAQDVSPERLRRFFVKVEQGYRVIKVVRDLCVFARQNIAEDPPFSQMNLVACRNMLIYFGSSLQQKVIPILHYALRHSGFLILGNSEGVTGFPNLFSTVDRKYKIFSKKTAASRVHYGFSTVQYPRKGAIDYVPAQQALRGPQGAPSLQQEADRIVLKNHAPAGVVVNAEMEIVQFRGRTSPYVEPAPGRASFNLLKMARAGLAEVLRKVINKAAKEGSARHMDVAFKHNEDGKSVNISVERLPGGSAPEDAYYLVLFEEVQPRGRVDQTPSGRSRSSSRSGGKDLKYLELQRRAASTEEQLQSVIESKEALEEEFQSASEEILSANEELQSTNEELETSKEELQSTNEELSTLNDELRNRNLELGHFNDDLNNLLSSTTLPVVMVDRGLRIRRATSASAEVLKIRASDLGRPITDIRPDITATNLEKLIIEVIDTLATKELEVQGREDSWYSLQIRPYRTLDDKIDGAVLVLTDITLTKSASERFKKAKEFSEAIIDTVREPLLVLDSDLKVIYANPSFFVAFQVSREETEKKLLYRLGNEQWNIPKLRALLEKVSSDDAPVRDFEVTHDFPDLGPRTMLLNARQIRDAHGDEPLILVAIEDITERKQWEDALRQSHDQLESQVQQRTKSLRRLSRHLQNAQDDERRKISRELHDSVGQYLVSVKMNLAQLNQPDREKAQAALSESDQLVEKCLAEIRTISHLLHPHLLDESGLASAAKWYVEGFGSRSGILTDLQISPRLGRLPQAVEMTLFRALQESLTNVHRHSGSSKVDIRIELEDKQIQLIVRDYGKGIAPEKLQHFHIASADLGVGLTGMRERVNELGGNLQLLSENPGTSVRVTIPIAKDHDKTGQRTKA